MRTSSRRLVSRVARVRIASASFALSSCRASNCSSNAAWCQLNKVGRLTTCLEIGPIRGAAELASVMFTWTSSRRLEGVARVGLLGIVGDAAIDGVDGNRALCTSPGDWDTHATQ